MRKSIAINYLSGSSRIFSHPRTFIGVIVSCVATLNGCMTVGPDYEPPEVITPDAWHQELAEGLASGESNLQSWWSVFDDPVLTELIGETAANNHTLNLAMARVDESRAFLGLVSGEKVPDLDAFGTAQRTRVSEATFPTIPPGLSRTDNLFQGGVQAFWELDFWGRVRRSVESASAGYEASVENYRDAQVILFAEVANNYMQVRSLQKRIELARKNLELQKRTLQLTKDRFEAGLVGELDVRQAELNLFSTESAIPRFKQALTRSINRLAVLTGVYPGEMQEKIDITGHVPVAVGEVVVNLPANLIRQRPDIRRAERELAAQNARIGVATAALYPTFALSGSLFTEGPDFDDLFDSGNGAFGFGPSFQWNLFDGGRVRSNIAIEEARTAQAYEAYMETLLLAAEETENALTAYVEERRRLESLEASVEAATKSAELVETLYVTGLTDFQNLLDMQRALFLEEDKLAESQGNVSQNLVFVYAALGGGWALDESDGN